MSVCLTSSPTIPVPDVAWVAPLCVYLGLVSESTVTPVSSQHWTQWIFVCLEELALIPEGGTVNLRSGESEDEGESKQH